MSATERRSVQTPTAVIMVRPHHFSPNEETVEDNAFQRSLGNLTHEGAKKQAYDEMTEMATTLQHAGVRVHVFDDTSEKTPDSVFPNNWFSTHQGGHVAIYPMFAPSRRKERRADIVEMLKCEYRVQGVIDYSGLEVDGLYLEGTGAMVLDHRDRVAYVVRSNRADPVALERFCTHFNYEPMAFNALDTNGKPVYHTNVLMCIATEFALIGLDFITDMGHRDEIIARIEESGRDVIALTNEQIANFAGNALEVQGDDGRLLALSTTAHDALTSAQKETIEKSAKLLPLHVPTIEMSGGSVRCMLAGVHLASR